jgi:uncharacterized protein YPO0396
MGGFLRKCQEESDDLDASIASLPSFLAKLDNIRREDLPRHEARFKDRLNDTVTKEIGVFHSDLQNEGRRIERKIGELNEALRELPYNDGTFMRLDARSVKNAEVAEFRGSLRSCLDDTFDDTPASREARFQRIEALIGRLSEESTWRDRVIDVRRWYDFGACEIDRESGESRSYYEDSSGQSGGEKARLAFTILVAAIAYQYDLDLTGRGNVVSPPAARAGEAEFDRRCFTTADGGGRPSPKEAGQGNRRQRVHRSLHSSSVAGLGRAGFS